MISDLSEAIFLDHLREERSQKLCLFPKVASSPEALEPLKMHMRQALFLAEKTSAFSTDTPLIVAVSGGADSLALWYTLIDMGLSNPLFLATCDHRLREESGIECQSLLEMAERQGHKAFCLPLQGLHKDQEGHSSEQEARVQRWQALERLRSDHPGAWLVLGQQLEDQAETLIMHYFRGAALDGLVGMQVCDAKRLILRPWLKFPRKAIREHLQNAGIPYFEDPSNSLPVQLRNRMRLELAPLLQELWGENWPFRLAKSAEDLYLDRDYLERQAALWGSSILECWSEVGEKQAYMLGGSYLYIRGSKAQFAQGESALRRRLLRQLYATWMDKEVCEDLSRKQLLAWEKAFCGMGPCPELSAGFQGEIKADKQSKYFEIYARTKMPSWTGFWALKEGLYLYILPEHESIPQILEEMRCENDQQARHASLVGAIKSIYNSCPKIKNDPSSLLSSVGHEAGASWPAAARASVLHDLQLSRLPATLRRRVLLCQEETRAWVPLWEGSTLKTYFEFQKKN